MERGGSTKLFLAAQGSRRVDTAPKRDVKGSPVASSEKKVRMARKPFHTTIEQVENWPARLNAVVKRLIMNRDVFALSSIFAWGRMTVTIKHPDTNETMELWKPKRVDTIALFAYIYINREALFREYSGYEFLFEDATGVKVAVADLGGPGVTRDFLALQQELDLHWGVHKRRLCPALRQPHLITRPVCPAILNDAAPTVLGHLLSPTAMFSAHTHLPKLKRSPTPPPYVHGKVSPPAIVPCPEPVGMSPTVPSADHQQALRHEEHNAGMWSLIAAAEMLDRQENGQALPQGYTPQQPAYTPAAVPSPKQGQDMYHPGPHKQSHEHPPGPTVAHQPHVRYAPYYHTPKPLSARCEYPAAPRVEAPQFAPQPFAAGERKESAPWRPW